MAAVPALFTAVGRPPAPQPLLATVTTRGRRRAAANFPRRPNHDPGVARARSHNLIRHLLSDTSAHRTRASAAAARSPRLRSLPLPCAARRRLQASVLRLPRVPPWRRCRPSSARRPGPHHRASSRLPTSCGRRRAATNFPSRPNIDPDHARTRSHNLIRSVLPAPSARRTFSISGGAKRRPLVGSGSGAWDQGPGFHPLPHQTVREVFPHTAFRQPSPHSMRVCRTLRPFG